MIRTFLLAVFFGFLPMAAHAEEFPFQYTIDNIGDSTITPGWSVLTLIVKSTGKNFIKEIEFYCQFKNEGGFTWAGSQRLMNLDVGQQATIRVAAEGDTELFNKPNAAKCIISKFAQSTVHMNW